MSKAKNKPGTAVSNAAREMTRWGAKVPREERVRQMTLIGRKANGPNPSAAASAGR